MKHALIGLFTLLLALPAFAERMQSIGEYDIYYTAFPSSFLQPDIAAAAGLIRSKQEGVLNVAVHKDGKPVPAQVTGTMRNLIGHTHSLTFKQVREDTAIYHLAQFPIRGQDTLQFQLNVQPTGDQPFNVNFTQAIYPD